MSRIGDVTCDEDFVYNADDTPQVTCDRVTDQWTAGMDGECKQRFWRTNVVCRLLSIHGVAGSLDSHSVGL